MNKTLQDAYAECISHDFDSLKLFIKKLEEVLIITNLHQQEIGNKNENENNKMKIKNELMKQKSTIDP